VLSASYEDLRKRGLEQDKATVLPTEDQGMNGDRMKERYLV
jgi:hypothetical protein